MRSFAIVLVVALSACATDGDDTLEVVHDACQPLELIAAGASDAEASSIEEASAMWNALGRTDLYTAGMSRSADAPAGRRLEVRFESAAPVFHGLYDDEHGVVYINHRLGDPRERAITIAHEVGHALGMFHVEDRPSVMNPENLTLEPNREDAAELDRMWGPCPAS